MQEAQGTPARSNQMLYILLGVVAVLLVVIVLFLTGVIGGSGTETTSPVAEAPSTGGEMPQMPSVTEPVEFDPATATRVPAGETPEQYVVAYFDAVVAGDYTGAYDRLPADKKAASTEDQFAEQLTGYGITAYTIDEVSEEGDEARVQATASMAGGAFQYLWTFVKDGDEWLVKSRTLPGMGQ
ncbi:MAG: hypothetical protein ISP10_00930 [Aeromicrobium sp.]|nr:hypothetical protein [Aeromicrobium sp.]